MLLRFFKRFFLFSHPAFSQFKGQGCPGCCQEQSCRPHSRELRILCLRSLCILSARRCRCHFCSSVPGVGATVFPSSGVGLPSGTGVPSGSGVGVSVSSGSGVASGSGVGVSSGSPPRPTVRKLFRLLCQRYIQFAVSLIYKLQRIRNQA